MKLTKVPGHGSGFYPYCNEDIEVQLCVRGVFSILFYSILRYSILLYLIIFYSIKSYALLFSSLLFSSLLSCSILLQIIPLYPIPLFFDEDICRYIYYRNDIKLSNSARCCVLKHRSIRFQKMIISLGFQKIHSFSKIRQFSNKKSNKVLKDNGRRDFIEV